MNFFRQNVGAPHAGKFSAPNDRTGEHWVTIGAVDGEGGTPVQLDKDGVIVKGPRNLTGAPVSDIGRKGQAAEHRKAADLLGEQEGKPGQSKPEENKSENKVASIASVASIESGGGNTAKGGTETGKGEKMAIPEKIRKTSSSRNVDAYQVGGRLQLAGGLAIVTKSKRTTDDQGSYVYDLTLRAATPSEEKQTKIANLRHKLSVGFGDSPTGNDARKQADSELRALEGRPTAEQENAAAKSAQSEKMKEMLSSPDMNVRGSALAQAHASKHGKSIGQIAQETGIANLSDVVFGDVVPTAEQIAILEKLQ